MYSTIQNRRTAKSVFPSDFPPVRSTDPYTFNFHVHSVVPFELGPLMGALITHRACKPISLPFRNWIMCSAVFWGVSIHRSGMLERLGRVMSFRLSRRMGVLGFLLMMKATRERGVVNRSFRSFFQTCHCKIFVQCVYYYKASVVFQFEFFDKLKSRCFHIGFPLPSVVASKCRERGAGDKTGYTDLAN